MNNVLLLCAVSLLLLAGSGLAAVPSLAGSAGRRYGSIFSIGDSFADTGNNPVISGWYSLFDPIMRPPYGSTFFGRPTGRASDGRLILDFVAECLGLPYLPPFLAHNASFRRGANFAVGGATALEVDAGFFPDGEAPGANKFPLNISLGVQLQWFESLKPSLCGTIQDCKDFFGGSLFFVGEFGVNDYFPFGGKSVQEVRSFVPDVVRAISMAIERLIKHGATSLVVPGVIPSGCTPLILALFADRANPEDYDSRTGCLKDFNELGMHHNSLLQEALEKLRTKHPDARIIYADFFGPIMEMVESPAKFGFEEDVLTICCGGPGTVTCGDPGATTCENPSARLFWDGVHLTEAAYRYIADCWLSSINSPARTSSQ